MRRSVRRCGGAPLHAAALGSRAVPLRESPATCFVPGVPSRNKHLHATRQTALQTFRPEFPGDWVDVSATPGWRPLTVHGGRGVCQQTAHASAVAEIEPGLGLPYCS